MENTSPSRLTDKHYSTIAWNSEPALVKYDTDLLKSHIEKAQEELGWNWGKKLVNAKKGDIINICGMKVQVQ